MKTVKLCDLYRKKTANSRKVAYSVLSCNIWALELGIEAENISYHRNLIDIREIENNDGDSRTLLTKDKKMNNRIPVCTSILAMLLSSHSLAQRENGVNSQLELGIITTTGNTEDESIKVKGRAELVKDSWDYTWSVDAFRSSRQNQLTAQRFYTVGSADYQLSEISFVEGRLAYEDDRFSGYDSQTDASINYGRSLLNNKDNMDLSVTTGIGVRRSLSEEEDFDEVIFRLAGDYKWDISENAMFNQLLSAEAGEETSIYRWESSIETNILENLSLKFTYNIKHQTQVPAGRERTDTATSVTLVMNF